MICQRLHGGSIRDCGCMLRDKGGWLECPPEARRVLPKYAAHVGTQRPAGQFTGDLCADCGGLSMVRTGTCLTCQDCGSTSGGCS